MNKSYKPEECMKALDMATKFNVGMHGGSDIHLNRHVGICPCYAPRCDNIFDLVRFIKAHKIVPLDIRWK